VSVLEEIVAHKRGEIAARKRVRPLEAVQESALVAPEPRDFAAALAAPGLSVIAEIKRRSPARGDLRVDLDPVAVARRYETYGASAMSVLTDEHYFKGSDSDLQVARGAVGLPVLRKDFTVEPYQVYEARALGADAVLLIVRALGDRELAELLHLAGELGLAALVEVHDAAELRRAAEVGASIIGVNNRNLDTLTVDPATSLKLRELIPANALAISESGISQPALAGQLAAAGYDAILVGEALVVADNPARLLQELRQAGCLAAEVAPLPPNNGGFPVVAAKGNRPFSDGRAAIDQTGGDAP
jgi:indole-3-glycerol phosphate synthase